MLVVGKGSLDRIAQQRDELDVGKQSSGPLGYQRMDEIVGSCVEGDGAISEAVTIGKAPPVVPHPLSIVKIEVMDFLAQGRHHVGMLDQVIEDRCGAAALSSDDQGGGKAPEGCSELAIIGADPPQWPLHTLDHHGLGAGTGCFGQAQEPRI